MSMPRAFPFTLLASYYCKDSQHWACHGRYGIKGNQRTCKCLCHTAVMRS